MSLKQSPKTKRIYFTWRYIIKLYMNFTMGDGCRHSLLLKKTTEKLMILLRFKKRRSFLWGHNYPGESLMKISFIDS